MGKYQVVITEKAEIDMESIYYYVATKSLAPDAAMEQYNRIANQILTLTDMPAKIRINVNF